MSTGDDPDPDVPEGALTGEPGRSYIVERISGPNEGATYVLEADGDGVIRDAQGNLKTETSFEIRGKQ